MDRMIKTAAICMALALSGFAAAQTTAAADDSTFKAWGGKAGIQAVMEDFVPRLQADARIGAFFKSADREHLIGQLTEQLCQESGGPCQYRGARMGPVHAPLNISASDFNALVEVLQQSMDAKGIPFAAQNAMLARLAPMHRDIVTQR